MHPGQDPDYFEELGLKKGDYYQAAVNDDHRRKAAYWLAWIPLARRVTKVYGLSLSIGPLLDVVADRW